MATKQKNRKSTREKRGYCNICTEYGPLTDDHVPPKGAYSLSRTKIHSLQQWYDRPKSKPTISQKGNFHKTLCASCNNVLLGSHLDPEIIRLTQSIRPYAEAIVKRRLSLPPVIKQVKKPQRLARAIIGHMMAGLERPHRNTREGLFGPYQDTCRSYVLDFTVSLPQDLDLYYWFYPGNAVLLIDFCALMDIGKPRETVNCGFMKFFPFGFLLTFKKPPSLELTLAPVLPSRSVALDEEVTTSFDLANRPPATWPEIQSGNQVLLLSDRGFRMATPAKAK